MLFRSLINTFIAILNESYTEVVECPENDFTNADLGSFIAVYLSRNLKILGKRFASFLKRPFKDINSKMKRKNKRWTKKEGKEATEIDRLFSNEVEKGRGITTVCPIASPESLEEIDEIPDENADKNNSVTFADSGNISLSVLSIDELYEAKEDDEVTGLLQEVKEVAGSMEFILGVTPLQPIKESIV